MSVSSTDVMLADQFSSSRLNYSFSIAVTALMVYEYAVTFPQEVNLFWGRTRLWSSAIFFANRYLSLLYLGVWSSAYPFGHHGNVQWCSRTIIAREVIACLPFLPWAVFSAMRVYALSGRKMLLSAGVFLLSCAPFATNLARVAWYDVYEDPYWGCQDHLTLPRDMTLGLVLGTRVALIVADIIVVTVIALAAYKARKLQRLVLSDNKSFVALLLRDGAIYFITLFLMNTLHLLMTVLQVTTDATHSGTSQITTFTNLVTSILISRALLNLRKLDTRVTGREVADMSYDAMQTLRFPEDDSLPSSPGSEA